MTQILFVLVFLLLFVLVGCIDTKFITSNRIKKFPVSNDPKEVNNNSNI